MTKGDASDKGRRYRSSFLNVLSNFSKEESLFFIGGRGIESLVVAKERSDWSLLPLVGTVPIFCHPGFERCIEFRSCKIHERISWYIVAAIFRTTISQFRRERVRVNARTTRMILGDLRSPNRSQITFALVLMAGVHVSVQLSTRIQFHRVVHSTLYKWNELYPTLIIIVL